MCVEPKCPHHSWKQAMLATPSAQEKSVYAIFEYLYRDASNYKSWGKVLLRGTVGTLEIQDLSSCLIDSSYFVAEQVGVPVLCEELYQLSGGMTEDDHAFHEFGALRNATREETKTLPIWGSVEDLLQAFREARALGIP